MIRTVSKWVLALSLALVATTPLFAAGDQGCEEANKIMQEQDKAKAANKKSKEAATERETATTENTKALEAKKQALEAKNQATTKDNEAQKAVEKATKAVGDKEKEIADLEKEIEALKKTAQETETVPWTDGSGPPPAPQPTQAAIQAQSTLKTKEPELAKKKEELTKLKEAETKAKEEKTKTAEAKTKADEASTKADEAATKAKERVTKAGKDEETANKDEDKLSRDLFELVRSKTGRAAMRCTKVNLTPAGAAWAYSKFKTGNTARQNAKGTGEYDLFSKEKPAGTAAEQAKKAAALGGFGEKQGQQSTFEKNIQARIQENMDLRERANREAAAKEKEIAAIPRVESTGTGLQSEAAREEKARRAAIDEQRRPFIEKRDAIATRIIEESARAGRVEADPNATAYQKLQARKRVTDLERERDFLTGEIEKLKY